MPHTQGAYRLRFDWGPSGARAITTGADVVVVVDVLSFTTTLSVALDVGAVVLPYRWADAGAARFAADRGAVLATGRSAAGAGGISLSPGTVRRHGRGARIVLPSPNGSALALTLGAAGHRVAGASLRNAGAVAAWIAASGAATVAVVASGERWDDGGLRPAVEDLWGAGAVIRPLLDVLPDASPEARVAADAWTAVAGELPARLRDCASGRELIGRGFAGDVLIAAEAGAGDAVPLLRDGVFGSAGSGG